MVIDSRYSDRARKILEAAGKGNEPEENKNLHSFILPIQKKTVEKSSDLVGRDYVIMREYLASLPSESTFDFSRMMDRVESWYGLTYIVKRRTNMASEFAILMNRLIGEGAPYERVYDKDSDKPMYRKLKTG